MAPEILRPVIIGGLAAGIWAWLRRKPPILVATTRVVDASTGKGVTGVVVSAVRINTEDVLTSVTTGTGGGYTLGTVAEEEFGLRLDGRAVGYESGWVHESSTGTAHVVGTWGEANSWGPDAPALTRITKLS
ncbi:hypothetical protein ACOCJ5_13575 [Knoellia sp. CPCC 206450]|uniref:hypothetical protein n=1 Tax=Knoellia tibetensis TaxID=3404798 RepID=UPI003B436642